MSLIYWIHKENLDGIDWLPNIVDTAIWKDFDPGFGEKVSREVRVVAALYTAVANRENYFQVNTPTAFGNPDYCLLEGIVQGILLGAELTESTQDDQLVFRKGRRTILKVDKVHKPESYYEETKENRKVLKAFGIDRYF